MIVLGINAYHGDASACVLADGRLVAALEEERLRRVKHWAGFPSRAIRACLAGAGLTPRDVDHVAIGRRPTANLAGKLAYVARRRPSLTLLRDRASNLRRVRDVRAATCAALGADPATFRARFHHVEHHRAHLASSFFTSPFERAVSVSLDGFGDFASTMWAVASGSSMRVRHKVVFPHSLGVLYTAGTQFLGFERFGDEYKVMGLAAWGEPEYAATLRGLIRLLPGGAFRLDLAAFRHQRHVVDTHWDEGPPRVAPYWSGEWRRLFGPPRRPGEPVEARHRNLARSLQDVTEEVVFHVLDRASALDATADLCLSGGCAFNSVINGKILARTRFERLFVHPAAGDAGTAVGAACSVWHEVLGRGERHEMQHAFLGPSFDDREIRSALDGADVRYQWVPDERARIEAAVAALEAGGVVGWFQGRTEWGPRALGNRSILADPRRAETARRLNDRVKRRESFRPFAPAVLEERAHDLFEDAHPSPFMNRVFPIRPAWRERLAAVTHVDGSGRLQTVSRAANPAFHALIEAFARRTGVPAVLNTSFNENEPIVNTPAEAIDCFRRARMDLLVVGPAVVRHAGGDAGE